MRVLAIDDSPTMRAMLSAALVGKGFEVVTANNSADGLDKLQAGGFRAVITDINMPVMDGFAFIRAARAAPAGKSVPILILTTESSDDKRAAGRAAGATGWIVKPFDPDSLVRTLHRVIV